MKTIAFALTAAITLSSCGPSAYDRCQRSRNPMECQQWSDAGGSVDDYLVGGMMGYTWANMNGQRVISVDRGYHGPTRQLHSQIVSQDRQISRLQQKVANQKDELRRQQTARTTAASRPSTSSFKSVTRSSSSSSRSGKR